MREGLRSDRKSLCALSCLLLPWAFSTLSLALADVRILASPGGSVGNYLNFSQVRRSGERVIIDGPCLSACTLASALFRATELRHLEGGPRVPCAQIVD